MKRTLIYLSLIPVLIAAVAWAAWGNRVMTTDAETTPRLSVQVCWPTAWGARPNAIAWLAPEEYARPAPGSVINPPSAVSHDKFIFDKPVSVLWNYGTHIQATYGDDVPRDTTVVTAMWSPTSGGFRYVGQVSTNVAGIAQIHADLCNIPAPAPAPPARHHVMHPVVAAPAHAPAPIHKPIGPRPIQNLKVDYRLKFNQMNSGQQYVYFSLTDEHGKPVSGARIDITVRYPNAVRKYGYGPSDHNGQMYIWFDVGKVWGGYEVPIDIVASYHGTVTHSKASFWVP